jgi:hypothetical protein
MAYRVLAHTGHAGLLILLLGGRTAGHAAMGVTCPRLLGHVAPVAIHAVVAFKVRLPHGATEPREVEKVR